MAVGQQREIQNRASLIVQLSRTRESVGVKNNLGKEACGERGHVVLVGVLPHCIVPYM